MYDWVRRVADADLPVLVQGESGSGKEGVSQALHSLSGRQGGPFVAINCTALTETLLEAELFGASRGAYTGADRDRPGLFRQAHRGTLFLDEVGDMPPAMQAKLLRALELGRVRPVGGSREFDVDVRVVAATHRDLARRVAEGAFRADLYYRLAVLQVHVPPLRERLEDLPLLVAELAPRLARQVGRRSLRLGDDAWLALRAHSWPGNVRELHSVLARALLRSNGGTITARHLGPWTAPAPSAGPVEAPVPAADEPLENGMIAAALRASAGSVAGAARRIGWTRQKLYRRIKVLGIRRPARAIAAE
jgi:DNA-binding NtrC family response regulator